MSELKELTLPAYAMLDGCHEHDLDGRDVILHVRSGSIIEIFERDKIFLHENVITYKFLYRNRFGVAERMIAALHYCPILDANEDAEQIKQEILKPAAQWYCDYAMWEDENIERGEGLYDE